MKIKALALLFFLTTLQTVQPVIIIVHGSFSASTDWWKPEGDFFKVLEAQAATLGHQTVSFCWSGLPTEAEILTFGTVLAQLIRSYPSYEEKILIGHSHGGNVIMAASKHFQAPLGQPQSFDIQATVKSLFGIIMQDTPSIPAKQYALDKVYLLGTPVNTQRFCPDMKNIGLLVNLYSENDWVQQVAGLYDRRHPEQERIANIEVLVKQPRTNKLIKPGHAELHAPYIGRWLLHIPDFYGKSAQVIFDDNNEPVYSALK